MKKLRLFWKANSLFPFFYGVVESVEPGWVNVRLDGSLVSTRILNLETTPKLARGVRSLFYIGRNRAGDAQISARIAKEFERFLQLMLAGETIRVISQGLEQEFTPGWVQVVSSEFKFVGLVPPSKLNETDTIAKELDLIPIAILPTRMGLNVIFSPKALLTEMPKDHYTRQEASDRKVHTELLTLGSVVMAAVVDLNRDGFNLDYGSGVGTLPLNQLQKKGNGKREKLDLGEVVAAVVMRNADGAISFTRRPFERLAKERMQQKETWISRFLQLLYWQLIIG